MSNATSNLVVRLIAHVSKLEIEGHEYGCKQIDYGDDGPQFINEDNVCTCGWAALKKEALQGETRAEPAACVYVPPNDGNMWLTGCGHEHHKDADLDLYDFCPYCGKPVEEGTANLGCDDAEFGTAEWRDAQKTSSEGPL